MYDAIIVGARCAGSPTGMLLARKGYRVLVVDRATFPSDTVSTHILWPQGVDAMARWGLLERLAATGCPTTARDIRYDLGDAVIRGGVVGPDGPKTGYCPRRRVLDKILVDAAVESGAELREAFTVDALVWDGDRVTGIKGHARDGQPIEERARIVVGADGVNSMVARTVQADEYDSRGTFVCYYYSYFSGFGARDIEGFLRAHEFVTIIPTHDDLTLIAGGWHSQRFQKVRAGIEGSMATLIEKMPELAERYRAAKREEKWTGTAGVPNYLRKPYGPGWALVGDAGYERDPITGQGISDAFLDAENLTVAIDEGFSGRRSLEDALADYETRRKKRVKAMFNFTCQLAALGPLPPPMQQLMSAVQHDQEAADHYLSAITGSVPLSGFLNAENIGRIFAKASAAS